MIKKRENAIESIIVHAQCRTLEETLKLYNGIDRQN